MSSSDSTHSATSSRPGPAHQEDGKAKANQRASRRLLCTEVTRMPDEFQKLTDRLLVEGAKFEEVIETVAERGGPRLTLGAVRDYFRRNPTLQMQRVRHQVEAAKKLKAALGNPDSAESELAEAAFMTGFMCLSRDGTEPSLKDAERARYERENLHLKQHLLRLKEKRAMADLQYVRARTDFEKTRRRKLEGEVKQLLDQVTQGDQPRELKPETIAKIREIYGIVKAKPPVPAAPENE
jgi:hypothetical protein